MKLTSAADVTLIHICMVRRLLNEAEEHLRAQPLDAEKFHSAVQVMIQSTAMLDWLTTRLINEDYQEKQRKRKK